VTGTPASKLCSPRESVLGSDPVALARAGSPSRCSPGLLPLQSSLHHDSGSGLSQLHTRQGKPCTSCVSGKPAVSPRYARPDFRRPGFMNPGSAGMQGRSNPTRHRQAATLLHEGFANPRDASRQPPRARCHAREAICPCPLSAALRASLPFTPSYPRRGPRRRVSETLLLNRQPVSAPHGAARRLTPREASQIPRCRVDHDPRAGRGP